MIRPRTDPATSRRSRYSKTFSAEAIERVSAHSGASPARASVDCPKSSRYPLRPLCRNSIGLFVMIHCLTTPVRRWSVVLIIAAVLAACSATQDFDLANAAIAHFRELMAAQQFDAISPNPQTTSRRRRPSRTLRACSPPSIASSVRSRAWKETGGM